ncbi:MAG: 50S ribosomal protein L10 [Bacillota bacterium]|nr:50S ribosomal protein L10 [Bacillota bacterium]
MLKIEEKKKVVAELEAKLKSSRAAIFTDYRGLNVAEANQLRRSFREAGSEIRVVKNTLIQLAVKQGGFEGVDQFLTGPTAVAFDFRDPVVPARLLIDFAKTNRKLEIKGGLIEGRVAGSKEIKYLADLPSRDVLISQVVRGIASPLAGLSSVLQGPLRKLVYALKAIQEQKAAG